MAASDAAPLGRAATVVGDGRDVGDGGDLEARRLQAADGRLATGAGALDEDLDGLQAVLHRLARGVLRGHLRREGRALARALEALASRRSPGDDIALGVGEADP